MIRKQYKIGIFSTLLGYSGCFMTGSIKMFSVVTVFGRIFSTYSLIAIGGMIVTAVFCALQCRFPRKKAKVVPDMQDILMMLMFASFGLFIGAKIMFAFTSLNFTYSNELNFFENLWNWAKLFISGGMVFYGGLIGAAAGGILYIFRYKTPIAESVDLAFSAVPLFHAIGRVGCFMGGCCYGIPYHGPFAVSFPPGNLGSAPAGVELLPIQLIESALNLILWGAIFTIYRKTSRHWLTTGLYLTCYGVMRFILEYFRGDLVRGHLGTLSSSQFISIFIVIIGVFLLIKPKFTDKLAELHDAEYEKELAQLNQRRYEYKKAIKARRDYRKQYIKDYRAYLRARKGK